MAIVEKKIGPVLHKQKCKGCDYYTIYSALPSGEKAIDTCTHCGYAVEIPWHFEMKSVFKNADKFLKNLEEICPELKDLKNPGDHIKFD